MTRCDDDRNEAFELFASVLEETTSFIVTSTREIDESSDMNEIFLLERSPPLLPTLAPFSGEFLEDNFLGVDEIVERTIGD